MNRITYILLVALFAFIPEYIYSADLWVEAEGFDNKGGWVVTSSLWIRWDHVFDGSWYGTTG